MKSSIREFADALAALDDTHWEYRTLKDDGHATLVALGVGPDSDEFRYAREVSDRLIAATLIQLPETYVDVELVAGNSDETAGAETHASFISGVTLWGARLLQELEGDPRIYPSSLEGLSRDRQRYAACVPGPWFVVELIDEAGGPIIGVATEPIHSTVADNPDVLSKVIALTYLAEPAYLTSSIDDARKVARFIAAAGTGYPDLLDELIRRLPTSN